MSFFGGVFTAVELEIKEESKLDGVYNCNENITVLKLYLGIQGSTVVVLYALFRP